MVNGNLGISFEGDISRPKYTRSMICNPDGTLDTYIIETLLKKGVRLQDLPLIVAYYARVSTDEENQLHSLQSQRKWYTDMINENENWTLYKGFYDEGISGTSVKKREHFLEMIEDAKQHKFDLIITKEISRFARNTVDSLQYTRMLLKIGVGVWFESDSLLTFEPDSELRLTIMSSMAQEESRKTSERVRRGNRASIKAGVVLGNDRIYGYDKSEGKLVVNEQEAEMVRLIYDLYANQFYGLRKVARIIYDKGYRNYDGNRISETTIKRMITNPKYKGFYCGGKTTKFRHLDSTVKKIPKEEWVMYKDQSGETVPAIVSEELWEKANRIMEKKVQIFEGQDKKVCFNGSYPYSGKIICEEHDKSYCRSIYRNKRKDGTYSEKEVWQCATYIKQGRSACDKPTIYTEELDEIIYKIVCALIQDKEALFKRIDDICIEAMNNPKNSKLKVSIEEDIVHLGERRNKLLDLLIAGRIKDEEFDERNKQLNEQIAEKQAKLCEIEAEDAVIREMASKAGDIKAAILEAMEFKEGFDRGVVDNLIDKIIVKKESSKKEVILDIYLKCLNTTLKYWYQKTKSSASGPKRDSGEDFNNSNTSIRGPKGPISTTNRSESPICNTSICSPLEVLWWS